MYEALAHTVIAGKMTLLGVTLSTFVITSYWLKSLTDSEILDKPIEKDIRMRTVQSTLNRMISVMKMREMPGIEMVEKNL